MATTRVRYIYAALKSGAIQSLRREAVLRSELIDEQLYEENFSTLWNYDHSRSFERRLTLNQAAEVPLTELYLRHVQQSRQLANRYSRATAQRWFNFLGEYGFAEEVLAGEISAEHPDASLQLTSGMRHLPLGEFFTFSERFLEFMLALGAERPTTFDIRGVVNARLNHRVIYRHSPVKNYFMDIELEPPPVVERHIRLLEALCSGHPSFSVDYNFLSRKAPLSVIFRDLSIPWNMTIVQGRDDYDPLSAELAPFPPSAPETCLLTGGLTEEWFNKRGIPLTQDLTPLDPSFRTRPFRGIWRLLLYLPHFTKESMAFDRHSAAGVIQRCWRRHRERLRLRAFAHGIVLWQDTFLGVLPRDLLWFLYRFTRGLSPAAWRGLPPKMR
jgi:hypothetical protein